MSVSSGFAGCPTWPPWLTRQPPPAWTSLNRFGMLCAGTWVLFDVSRPLPRRDAPLRCAYIWRRVPLRVPMQGRPEGSCAQPLHVRFARTCICGPAESLSGTQARGSAESLSGTQARGPAESLSGTQARGPAESLSGTQARGPAVRLSGTRAFDAPLVRANVRFPLL